MKEHTGRYVGDTPEKVERITLGAGGLIAAVPFIFILQIVDTVPGAVLFWLMLLLYLPIANLINFGLSVIFGGD